MASLNQNYLIFFLSRLESCVRGCIDCGAGLGLQDGVGGGVRKGWWRDDLGWEGVGVGVVTW